LATRGLSEEQHAKANSLSIELAKFELRDYIS